MEVHHHPQVEKKNFKEYFLEFLMIFLAVTMGFFAENIREHIADDAKEKGYMNSMIEDLQKDTSNINTEVKGNRLLLSGLDTLLDLLSTPQNDTIYQRKLFICSLVNTYWYMPLLFSDLTISQLKYNGNFRLIQNYKVANGILQYEQGVETCKDNYDLLLNYYHIYEATNKELFNMSLARPAFKAIEKDFITVFLPLNKIEAMVPRGKYIDKNEPELFSKYHDDILYYQTTLSNITNITEKQKESADSLIQLIRKEYYLDKN
ncbi:MAG TPA: hypothetical protein VKR53_21335 [Puia sp.]|nr:hypothetical protein [Puia sp.]